MNLWHDLSAGPRPPELIHAIIEIPGNTHNKYEFDHHQGIFRLDRVLSAALRYPADYGLIPQTLYDDGDPLDVLVLINEATFPGCVITVRPLGIFRLIDDDKPDDKVLAVAHSDPYYEHLQRLDDVPAQLLNEIAHFFCHYKDLETKQVQDNGWASYKTALAQIEHAQNLYQQSIGSAPSGSEKIKSQR